MLLGFKTELNPNNKQITLLKQHCGVARHAYNAGLAYTKTLLDVNRLAEKAQRADLKIKFPSAIDLHKWLVAQVKPDCPWYYLSSKCAPQYALRELRTAWDRFFKNISGSPKFKKRGKNDSFTLDGSILCDGNRIKLPKIGWVRVFEYIPVGTRPKNVTISRQGDKWFVSYKIEVDPTPTVKAKLSVGVDLGLKVFATLSTGEILEAPVEEYKRLKAKIAKLQFLARNRHKGSRRWRKMNAKINRLYYRMSCLRKDFLHKATTYLAKNFGLIGLEDLNVKGMMSNHKLAGAIGLMGWHEFNRQMEYKTKLYGSAIGRIGQWEPSSKACFGCGWLHSGLTLADRVFNCQKCDWTEDRDVNAALNIERWASA